MFAEGELADPHITLHVSSCETCARLVEQARNEEKVLREQLRAELPRSLHADLMRALDASSDVRRRSQSRRARRGSRGPGSWSGPVLFSVAVLGLAALGVSQARKNALAPQEEPRAPEPPAKVVPAPAPSAPTTSASPVETPPACDPEPVVAPAPTPPPEPAPVASESNDAPPLELTERPQTPPAQEAPRPADPPAAHEGERPESDPAEATLALVRSGKLTTGGKALAAGDALPEGEVVEVAVLSELESVNAAKLVVAAGSKLSVKKGEKGEPVFFLASGKLLARSSGHRHYGVASPDGHATPLGTEFLVAVESARTRVSTVEGGVQVAVNAASVTFEVRAGFEAEVTHGKTPEAPHPFAAAKALSWLPETARPKSLPPQLRLIRAFGFEDGETAWTQGLVVPGGARGSKHALSAVPGDEGTLVELADERVTALDFQPTLWVEVSVKVDRPATVALELLGGRRKADRPGPGPGPRFAGEQSRFVELRTRVEPGRWRTIAAPLRDFVDVPPQRRFGRRHMGPQEMKPSDHLERFSVVAETGRREGPHPEPGAKGEPVELLVDDVRFYTED
jgi:hypothetical protein